MLVISFSLNEGRPKVFLMSTKAAEKKESDSSLFPDTGGGAVGPGWDTGNSGLGYGKIVLHISCWTWKLLVLGGCGISIL